MGCDNVACERWGVIMLRVKELCVCTCVCVCGRGCVAKMVCNKDVCEKCCVTKMCVEDGV